MRIFTRIGRVALMGLAGMLGSAGQGWGQVIRPEGPAEQVGQLVGGALDTAGRAVERSFRNAFARTRGAVESMEVTSRVYSRLLWDKELVGGRYIIDARPGGVVILRGSAPNPPASERAMALAASTVGVTQVINELVVPGSSAVVVPGPAVIVPNRGVIRSEPSLEQGPLPRVESDAEPVPAPRSSTDPEPLPDPGPVPAPTIQPPLPTPET